MPGIRQRRNLILPAPAFDPSRLAGLQAWYRADKGTFSDAGQTPAKYGDTVRQWSDQSGFGRHLSQATSGNRPSFINFAYGLRLPALRFTAANSQYLDTATFAAEIPQPTTVFIVARQANTANTQTYFDTSGGDEQVLLATVTGNTYKQYSGTNQAGGTPDTALNYFTCVFNGASSKTRKNGTQIIAANAGTQGLPQLRIGANPSPSSYFDGDVCEVVVYNRALSAGEIVQVEGYLSGRWSTTVPRGGCVMGCFPAASPVLNVWASLDGLSWNKVPVSYTPTTGSVRDSGVIYLAGTFWLVHTSGGLGASTSFEVASSPDGVTWTTATNVDCSSITGNTANSRAWAPDWVRNPDGSAWVDGSGTPHVIVALSSTGDPGNFQLYECSPTNAGFTTWSALTQLTGTSLPAQLIDPYTFVMNGVYYVWYVNEVASVKYIEVMSSSSLTSGYTVLRSGDWMGLGTNQEGPSPLLIGNQWLLYDNPIVGDVKVSRQTAGDWTGGGSTTWSAQTTISTGGVSLAHGSVFRY